MLLNLSSDSLVSADDCRPHYVVVENHKSGAEDEDESMSDCKSSNKFGLTYTESVITGISFNYSDLYR